MYFKSRACLSNVKSFKHVDDFIQSLYSLGYKKSGLGKVNVVWLLAAVEVLSQAERLKKFVKSSRVGNKASIAYCLASECVPNGVGVESSG